MSSILCHEKMRHIVRKAVFGASDQVGYKTGCTAKENGQRLKSLALGRRGIVLCSENKGAVQLRIDCTVLNNKFSSVTLNELAMKARERIL